MSDAVIVALIGALALIISTWMQRRPSKTLRATKQLAEKAVEQTEKTGNGFAKHTKDQLAQLHKSVGAVHRRLDQQEQVLTGIDDRLIHIEEKQNEDPPQ